MDESPGGGIRTAAEQIHALGAAHCIICTDFGVYTLPESVEGLREFIACLLDLGVPVYAVRGGKVTPIQRWMPYLTKHAPRPIACHGRRSTAACMA